MFLHYFEHAEKVRVYTGINEVKSHKDTKYYKKRRKMN